MKKEPKKIYKIVKINKLKIRYFHVSRKALGPKVSVLFLSGYKSDMEGTKATFIEKLAKKEGFEFIKFDYSGHGKSDGLLQNQTISTWLGEAKYFIEKELNYPTILIGSSLGGWISLLLLKKIKKKITGFIGIGTAPDFTKYIFEELTEDQKKLFKIQNFVSFKSEYEDSNFVFTKKFFKDAEKNFIIEKKIISSAKIVLLYGNLDTSVKIESQLKILDALGSTDCKLIIVKGSDHRMSNNKDLSLIKKTLKNLIKDSL